MNIGNALGVPELQRDEIEQRVQKAYERWLGEDLNGLIVEIQEESRFE